MRGPGRIALIGAAAIACLFEAPHSAVATSHKADPAREPTPEQDDATLHDVQCVGTQRAWAVGERGVIWSTADGGQTWQFSQGPAECALRSVCFLTDKIGWIVGGGISPYTHRNWGLVLGTTDGGQSWQTLAHKNVPYLHHIQFFGLEYGIALGEPSARFPTGVLITEDGGRTWQPMRGDGAASWRAGDFVDESTGYVGGPRGEHAPIGGGKLLPQRMVRLELRAVHDIALQPDGSGWMAGDGGLAMWTRTTGATWEEPTQPLPRELRDVMDFRAVACRGTSVWLAGSPGSVVWHSSDGGATWAASATGHAAPIHALSFSSDTQGCAVGALGQVLITHDSGATWQAVRGGGRRVALLTLSSRASRAPVPLITRAAGEQGYRAAVALAARHDTGPDGHLAAQADLQLQDAVVAAGGCQTEIGWRLPLALPGLEADYQQLTAHWMKLTDGRLPQVMLSNLVAQLRTWRPDVIVLDEASEDDAAAKLLRQAILHAVDQAADPARYPEQAAFADLKPWTVKKVFVRTPSGTQGTVTLDPGEILPRHGQTLAIASADSLARIPGAIPLKAPEGYALIFNSLEEVRQEPFTPQPSPLTTAREFFSGLSLPPGGDARRASVPITELDYELLERRAQHQRNFTAWSQRALDDVAQASQLIAQLKDVIGDAPKREAALQLAQLAEQYKQRSQWQLAEDTLIELVQRYPREPVSLEAMQWLLALWTSQEMGWQRLRAMNLDRGTVAADGQLVQNTVLQTQQLLQQDGGLEKIRELARNQNSPLAIQPVGGQIVSNGQAEQRQLEAGRWRQQAALLAATVEKVDSDYFQEPPVQFTYAALLRHRGQYQQADEIYRRFINDSDPVWQRAARGEMWVIGSPTESPKPVLRCYRVPAPPVLDGLLSDLCWQNAMDVKLEPDDGRNTPAGDRFIETRGVNESPAAGSLRVEAADMRPLVMLAYDAQYLYFAASLPRSPSQPADPPSYPGRTHDADLSGHDQISLLLDIDRDYATFYRFDVDSRARTREACWVDQKWDPQWHVACDADTQRWTVEAAIPLEALAPTPPSPGQTWAAGFVRTLPGEGVESWTHPTGAVPRPASFGLVRFD